MNDLMAFLALLATVLLTLAVCAVICRRVFIWFQCEGQMARRRELRRLRKIQQGRAAMIQLQTYRYWS